MQVQSPILGGFYQSRSLTLNAQRAVNVYAELVETQDGKEVGALYGTPGLKPFLTITGGACRGMHVMNGVLYVVVGDKVCRVTQGLTFTQIGSVQTLRHPVCMRDNGRQLLIVDGRRAYGYDSATAEYKGINLPFLSEHPVICAYQDGFFLINQSGTQSWWQSDLNNCFAWGGLNFSSADGQPDNIVTIVDNHREAWLLGQTTTEIWVNVGNPGFAFQRLQGVFIQTGCLAAHSAVVAGASVIWLSQTEAGSGMVVQSVGYQVKRISTHAIEREIQSYSRADDAIAYVYQQEGHLFYVITFPAADKTWVYDLDTSLWHERAEHRNGQWHRHRSNCYAFFNQQHVVGDFENGQMYALDLDTFTDNGSTRKWLRSWPAQQTGKITLNNTRYSRLQVYLQPGVGNTLPPGDNPQLMLRMSDDGGLAWGNERQMSVGKIGETQWRAIERRCGSGRDRVWEISSTDPCRPAILGAFLDVEIGNG